MSQTNLTKKVKDCLATVKITVLTDWTVEEAVNALQEKQLYESMHYFLAVDKEGVLRGVVAARALLFKGPKERIGDIMDKNVVKVSGTDTLGVALEVLNESKLLSVPVIDAQGILIGAVDVNNYLEESTEVINRQLSHDIFALFGVTLEEGKKGGAIKRFATRIPWILCNMFGGIFCAMIARYYEDVLAKMLIFAMFIPLVLTLSESISMQSMTQSLQQIRKNPIGFSRIFRNCLIEWKTIVLLAVTCGVLVGGISLFWGDGLEVGITIAIGLIAGIILSAIIGSTIPYLLHAKKLDPRVAAGPIVLMFADVLTTAIYLGLATYRLL